MLDGDEKEVKSATSKKMYKIKRNGDHYYCSCPAWRNAGGPVDARTCKHLKSLLGDEYESARLNLTNHDVASPATPPATSQKGAERATPKKTAVTKKGKAKENDDADGNATLDDDGKKVTVDLLLANKWDVDSGVHPTGWWISEKLDGIRTFYDGKQFISRLGNPFTPPQWFLDKLPKNLTLDGELFSGRGKFSETVSIVKTINSPHWKDITFQVFDVPSRGTEPFEDRMAFLHRTFGKGGTHASEQIEVVQHEAAKGREHVLEKLKEIEGLGGEGLMMRRPGSLYEGKRSLTLLKIKTFYDGEAIVTDHVPGKGRLSGLVGALICTMESGKTFNVGTGLSDEQRRDPPKIGSIINYRFQELTKDGVPRFPSYGGEAIDKDAPKDAEIPDHRKHKTKPVNVDL